MWLGLFFGIVGGLAALATRSESSSLTLVAVAAVLGSTVLGWWLLSGAGRWIPAILASVLLLPPLPLPWGDSGPHPAVLIASFGLVSGIARLAAWDTRWRSVSVAFVLLWFSLLISSPLAALQHGPETAASSLARVGLFSISVYLYFYLVDGPGRVVASSKLVRLVFWAGCGSALFACLDFYFQFPAPSRYAEQFVWLGTGVYRRAQGVFYEASTLGLFCTLLLNLIVAVAILRSARDLRIPRWALVAGSIVSSAALMLSFSRGAIINLGVSLAVMAAVERSHLGISGRALKVGTLVLVALAAGLAALQLFLPEFLTAYLQRLWYSAVYLADAPNLVLSRRLENWQLILDYIQNHPWQLLFGVGYKTLPYTDLVGKHIVADNTYLSLLVETGVAGLGALLFLLAAVLRACYRAARAPASSRDVRTLRLIGLWMFGSWCGLATQMWSADVLTYWRVLPLLFGPVALLVRDTSDADTLP